MNGWMVKILSLVCIIALVTVSAYGLYIINNNNKNEQVYLNYCVYINKTTGEAFLYNHGRFEPLYGADKKPIVRELNNSEG